MSEIKWHLMIILTAIAVASMYYSNHVQEEEKDEEKAEKKARNAAGFAVFCAMGALGLVINVILHTYVSWW